MQYPKNSIFFLLVLTQGLHSIEEYFGELWLVFPPATYLTSLVSSNLETGFIIINIGLFVFGIWGWYSVVLRERAYSYGLQLIWIVIEIANGIVHPAWALYIREYTPGVMTSPILLILAICLLVQIRKFDSLVETKTE